MILHFYNSKSFWSVVMDWKLFCLRNSSAESKEVRWFPFLKGCTVMIAIQYASAFLMIFAPKFFSVKRMMNRKSSGWMRWNWFFSPVIPRLALFSSMICLSDRYLIIAIRVRYDSWFIKKNKGSLKLLSSVFYRYRKTVDSFSGFPLKNNKI